MNFRLDEALYTIYERLGVVGLAVGFGLLAYAAFGPLLRVMGLSVMLLIGAQSWFTPVFWMSRSLRWWVLLAICVRGVMSRPASTTGGGGGGRMTATALAVVALASCLWAENPAYTLGVAASFVLSIVAAFVVLWRIMDTDDVLRGACSGALVLTLLLYGGSLIAGAYAYVTFEPEFVRRTGILSRFSGIFFNANMSGLLAMVLIPVLVATPRAWLGRLGALRLPAIAMAGVALALAGSRSAIIGTVLSLVLFALYRFGIGTILTLSIAAVGMYVVATSSHVEDVDATAIGQYTRTKRLQSLSGRVELWEEGLDAVEGHMALGLGWGSSRLLHGADPDEALANGSVRGASNLHSTHIQILVDVGFVGLGLLWLLCLQTLWAGWRLLRVPRTEHSTVDVMVVACFVATLADTFVHGSVLSTGSPSSLIFWSSSAILIKEAERVRRGAPLPPSYEAAEPAALPEPRYR